MLRLDIGTQEELKQVIDYDQHSGTFIWKFRNEDAGYVPAWNARYAGKKAGHFDSGSGYYVISFKKHKHNASRLAWLYMTGYWPPNTIDHINCIRSDDRFVNLRLSTFSQNLANRAAFGKSGLKGAYYRTKTDGSGQWYSCIGVSGKTVQLGCFSTAEEAHAAYAAAAVRLHGEFSRVR